MRKTIIWITGKDLLKPKSKKVGEGEITIRGPDPAIFEYAPAGDYFSITFNITVAPNFIHRFLQRVCFGVKYRMIK